MIPIFSNSLGDDELKAVQRVINSRWLGQGKECSLFEKEFGAHLGSERVLLTNNCTAAIYIALQALDISAGDEVIVSTINFVACANAIIDLGARPVFADVDTRTLNILPGEIERLKTSRTRAVVFLHYGGHPAPVDEIISACGDQIRLIEDSANSVWSSYRGRQCGTLGDAGVFSFDAMKILVMADGGALVVRDPQVYEKALTFRYLGLAPGTTSGLDSLKDKPDRWWEYDLATTSGRFVSNDVLAAIGREQLVKLPNFIARRQQIWETYQREFAEVSGISCPPEPLPESTSSYYLYWVQLPRLRDQLAAYLVENGVYTTFRYYPLHQVEYYSADCSLPNAEAVADSTLNLPLHQNLNHDDIQQICDLVRKFMRQYF